MSEKNKAYSLEKLTENLKKFIQDAAEGPLEERTNHKNPQFVGKKKFTSSMKENGLEGLLVL